MPVKGIDRVRANYRIQVDKIDGRVTDAAVHAILSEGQAAAATLTPVHTSNLINSATPPDIKQQKGKTVGTVGYTASYAGAVHAAPGTLAGTPRPDGSGEYWDPSAEPGFLSKGFDEVKPAIPAILKRIYGNV